MGIVLICTMVNDINVEYMSVATVELDVFPDYYLGANIGSRQEL